MVEKSDATKDGGLAAASLPEKEQPSRAAARFEVELIKPHTHAGKDMIAGEKIKVTASQRTWLQAEKVIAGDVLEK